MRSRETGLPTWLLWLALIVAVLVLAMVFLPQLQGVPTPGQTPTGTVRVIPGVTPDPRLSPGDVLTTDVRQICTPGYTKTVRNVPSDLKRQIYQEYGITSHKPGEYEIDHIISLELGGSNSARNLFPQSYKLKPLNAHVKDELENKLHELICTGKLPIQTAQQEIAHDWISAYQKYVGPLPTN